MIQSIKNNKTHINNKIIIKKCLKNKIKNQICKKRRKSKKTQKTFIKIINNNYFYLVLLYLMFTISKHYINNMFNKPHNLYGMNVHQNNTMFFYKKTILPIRKMAIYMANNNPLIEHRKQYKRIKNELIKNDTLFENTSLAYLNSKAERHPLLYLTGHEALTYIQLLTPLSIINTKQFLNQLENSDFGIIIGHLTHGFYEAVLKRNIHIGLNNINLFDSTLNKNLTTRPDYKYIETFITKNKYFDNIILYLSEKNIKIVNIKLFKEFQPYLELASRIVMRKIYNHLTFIINNINDSTLINMHLHYKNDPKYKGPEIFNITENNNFRIKNEIIVRNPFLDVLQEQIRNQIFNKKNIFYDFIPTKSFTFHDNNNNSKNIMIQFFQQLLPDEAIKYKINLTRNQANFVYSAGLIKKNNEAVFFDIISCIDNNKHKKDFYTYQLSAIKNNDNLFFKNEVIIPLFFKLPISFYNFVLNDVIQKNKPKKNDVKKENIKEEINTKKSSKKNEINAENKLKTNKLKKNEIKEEIKKFFNTIYMSPRGGLVLFNNSKGGLVLVNAPSDVL